MVTVRIRPALGLAKKTDAALTIYVAERINDLNLNIDSFPGLTPTPGQLKSKNDGFKSLLDISEPTKSQTIAKNTMRKSLEVMTYTCAVNCSEIADGNLDIYSLSGFGYQNKGTQGGVLPAPKNFRLELGPAEGQLYAKFKTVDKAHAYEIWYGPKENDPSTWTMIRIATSGKKVLLNELKSGVDFSARCRAVAAQGVAGLWSDIATKKTY